MANIYVAIDITYWRKITIKSKTDSKKRNNNLLLPSKECNFQ
jgi:hypothetical protein